MKRWIKRWMEREREGEENGKEGRKGSGGIKMLLFGKEKSGLGC